MKRVAINNAPAQLVALQSGLPVGSVDVLPSVAAKTWPHRAALRAGSTTVTFAEFDHRVSRLAAGLRQLLGGDGSVVAVSAVLGIDFPTAYYAVARSGNVVAPTNPRLSAEVFEQLLRSVRARGAILDRAMYERVRGVLGRLPELEQVLLLDAPAGPGVLTCAELTARGNLLVEPRDRDEREPGAVVLRGGLAGYAKSAGQTHHQLKADAAHLAAVHDLSDASVALTTLPSFDQTKLNAAVFSGATQVLCGTPDVGTALRELRYNQATHVYALPQLLTHLTAQPLLDGYAVADELFVIDRAGAERQKAS